MPQTLDAARRLRDVAQAAAYVRTRFYPPLPTAYAKLAVDAVAAAQEHGADALLEIPVGLTPLPRDARAVDGRRGLWVTAGALLCALRLDHLLADAFDDDDACAGARHVDSDVDGAHPCPGCPGHLAP